jgi:uncharacterized protein YceH (UPF0502 family)
VEALSDIEVRVLGSLLEKHMTTPDYYPMSLNALTAACNQSSNRDPVMQLDDDTVMRTIQSLREKRLVRAIKRSDSRVTKYQHVVDEVLDLDRAQAAVLCELLLRGPQTVGELRARASRMYEFASTEEIEQVIERLVGHEPTPLVMRLLRRPGQKEGRIAHLLAGEEPFEPTEAPAPLVRKEGDRLAALEEVTAELRREVADLRSQLEAFRKQFE